LYEKEEEEKNRTRKINKNKFLKEENGRRKTKFNLELKYFQQR
jgi:hypothetical protein